MKKLLVKCKKINQSELEVKICNYEHQRRIDKYCHQCCALLCDDELCLLDHLDHFESVQLVDKIFSEYFSLNDQIQKMRIGIFGLQKYRSVLIGKIEKAFEEVVESIIQYKHILIDQIFSDLIPKDLNFTNQRTQLLQNVSDRIKEIVSHIKDYINSKDWKLLMNILLKENYEQIKESYNEINQGNELTRLQPIIKNIKEFDLKCNFTPEAFRKLFQFNQYSKHCATSKYAYNFEKNGLSGYLFFESGKTKKILSNVKISSRFASISHRNFLYVSGGISQKEDYFKEIFQSNFFRYDESKEHFKYLNESPCAIADHSLVGANEFVISTGGYNNDGYLSKCFQYDIELESWSSLPNLHERKSHVSSVNLNNSIIYAIGGKNSEKSLSTIEKMNLIKILKGWKVLLVEGWKEMHSWKSIQINPENILIFGGGSTRTYLFNCQKNEFLEQEFYLPASALYDSFSSQPALMKSIVSIISDSWNIYSFSLDDYSWKMIESSKWK